jgi:hypothetical protein
MTDPSLHPEDESDAPMPRRDALRPRLLECIRACTLQPILAWDDAACTHGDLHFGGEGLWRLAQVVEDEFEIIVPIPDLLDLALDGPTMGRWLDLIEGRLDA